MRGDDERGQAHEGRQGRERPLLRERNRARCVGPAVSEAGSLARTRGFCMCITTKGSLPLAAGAVSDSAAGAGSETRKAASSINL